MKKVLLVLAVFAVMGVSKAAYLTADLKDAQETSKSVLENVINDCQDAAVDSKQLMSEFKRHKQTREFICERELFNSLKNICVNRIKNLKEVVDHFSSSSTNAIAENLGDGAPSDAIGAVQLWKARRSMENLKESESSMLESLLKKMTCKIAKNSLIANNSSFSQGISELIRSTQSTTLRSQPSSAAAGASSASALPGSGAQ